MRPTTFPASVDITQLAFMTTSYEFSFPASYTGSGYLTRGLCSSHTHSFSLITNPLAVPCGIVSKHASRNFLRAESYGALWENFGPGHPQSLGLQKYKNPSTSS